MEAASRTSASVNISKHLKGLYQARPSIQVGAVLGKGGATISQIRRDSGATVRLVGLDPDEERHLPRDLGSGQHRVISIAGDPDCALRALTAVTDLLQECQVPGRIQHCIDLYDCYALWTNLSLLRPPALGECIYSYI